VPGRRIRRHALESPSPNNDPLASGSIASESAWGRRAIGATRRQTLDEHWAGFTNATVDYRAIVRERQRASFRARNAQSKRSYRVTALGCSSRTPECGA
jgi:hypothetical protein